VAAVVTGAAVVHVRRRVGAASPAGGWLIGRAGANAIRPADPAAVAAGLSDQAPIGHAAASAVDAGR
jgi:hypothetical protein